MQENVMVFLCAHSVTKIPSHLAQLIAMIFQSIFQSTRYEIIRKTIKELNQLELDAAENDSDLNDDLDPDVNFYNELKGKKSLYYMHSELNDYIQKRPSDFSFVHLNCRSLKKNFDNLHLMLTNIDLKFDFIAVSETWLSDNNDLTCYKINGYNMEYVHRENRVGGGVVIYVSEKYNVNKIKVSLSMKTTSLKQLHWKLISNNTKST